MEKIAKTAGIVSLLGLGIGLVYLNRKSTITNTSQKTLFEKALEHIVDGFNRMFEPSISGEKRLKRWEKPLAYFGICTIRELIEEAEIYGLERLKKIKGIGEVGLNEIRIVLWKKTRKRY